MIRIILLLILLLPNLAFAENWCENVNIGACWTVETGSGTALIDISSNDNDGNFKGAGEPLWSASVPDAGDGFDGTSNWSLDFDGTNDYITGADTDTQDFTTSMTVVMWILVDANATNYGRIVQKNNRMWGVVRASGGLNIYQYNSAQGNGGLTTLGETGSWEHITAVYDTTTNYTTMWLNGVEDTVNRVSETTDLSVSDDPWFWGSENTDGYNAGEFQADEVATFSDAKDSTDINDIMDNGLVQAVTTRRISIIN